MTTKAIAISTLAIGLFAALVLLPAFFAADQWRSLQAHRLAAEKGVVASGVLTGGRATGRADGRRYYVDIRWTDARRGTLVSRDVRVTQEFYERVRPTLGTASRTVAIKHLHDDASATPVLVETASEVEHEILVWNVLPPAAIALLLTVVFGFLAAYYFYVARSKRRYRLEPDAICLIDARGEGRVAYGAIDRVWVLRLPGGVYQCHLHHSGGNIILASIDMLGAYEAEDRSASYECVVRELITRTAAASPRAAFLAGRSWLSRGVFDWLGGRATGGLIFLVAVLPAVFLAGAIIQNRPAPQTLAALAVTLGGWLAVALFLRWHIRRYAPRRFDPRALPADKLPE